MDKRYNEKLSLIRELINLSKIDNKLVDLEMNFIKLLAMKLGISTKDFALAMNEDIPFTPSENEFERIYFFQSIVMLMCIDQNIEEEEVVFCKRMGLKFGLNPAAVDTVLEKMIENPRKPIPTKELIKIYQLYHS